METKNEIWKDVVGYEGYYQVSNLGRVRSLERVVFYRCKNGVKRSFPVTGKVLKPNLLKNGYYLVSLKRKRTSKYYTVHRLVAKAFVPGYREGLEVNHKDENKQNNRADNLEWATRRENLHYGTAIKRLTINQKYRKPVIQMSLDGEFIRTFDSINKASAHTGIEKGNIRAACQGRYKKSGGYRWKFADK